jgi:hypothetical protein
VGAEARVPLAEGAGVGQVGDPLPRPHPEMVAALGADVGVVVQLLGVEEVAAAGALNPQVLGDLVVRAVVGRLGAELAAAVEKLAHRGHRVGPFPVGSVHARRGQRGPARGPGAGRGNGQDTPAGVAPQDRGDRSGGGDGRSVGGTRRLPPRAEGEDLPEKAGDEDGGLPDGGVAAVRRRRPPAPRRGSPAIGGGTAPASEPGRRRPGPDQGVLPSAVSRGVRPRRFRRGSTGAARGLKGQNRGRSRPRRTCAATRRRCRLPSGRLEGPLPDPILRHPPADPRVAGGWGHRATATACPTPAVRPGRDGSARAEVDFATSPDPIDGAHRRVPGMAEGAGAWGRLLAANVAAAPACRGWVLPCTVRFGWIPLRAHVPGVGHALRRLPRSLLPLSANPGGRESTPAWRTRHKVEPDVG